MRTYLDQTVEATTTPEPPRLTLFGIPYSTLFVALGGATGGCAAFVGFCQLRSRYLRKRLEEDVSTDSDSDGEGDSVDLEQIVVRPRDD